MNILLDTNVVISALLWQGVPRRLFDHCISDSGIILFASAAMLEELRETLAYPKLAKRVALAGSDADGITAYYAALIQRIEPEIVGRYVPNDPDDDMIVAAAMAAQVTMIISGDRHLFELDGVVAIPVLTPAEAYEVLVGR